MKHIEHQKIRNLIELSFKYIDLTSKIDHRNTSIYLAKYIDP